MPAGPGAGPSGYVSKTDLVAALIRELIITGELAAGGQLRQRELAQRFGVSQTPVREAMRRLESEGLVVGDTHRGFTVVELDDRMRALADDDPRYADLNREFHFTVYSCAGSPLLLTLMRLLWASLHGGPRVQRSHAESASQHDAILDALRSGDAAAASALTYQHIMGAAH